MARLRNIVLELAYDGRAFAGWQRQKGKRTVQQTLEQALRPLVGHEVSLLASGRTDAGVHALRQVANFRTESRRTVGTIQRALNASLPEDVRVLAVHETHLAFHATYDARAKLYRYVYHDAPVALPLARGLVARSIYRLDTARMRIAADELLGQHDFRSFQTAGAPRASTVRTIFRSVVVRSDARWLWHPDMLGVQEDEQGDYVYIELAADGFLYNMVRAIAGTLYNIGRGYWAPEMMRRVLCARRRAAAGPTAPAHGLYLVRVWYEALPAGWGGDVESHE